MKHLFPVSLSLVLVASAAWAENARRVVVADVTKAKPLVHTYAVLVESRDTVSLSFPVSGKLAVRQAPKDAFVRKGQVLAELDSEEFQQRVTKAKCAAERAAMTLQRMRKVPKGVSSEQVSLAEAEKLVADAELRIAEKALVDTKIVAPFDGLVVNTSGDIGQVIAAGSVVSRLHSRAVNVKLNVPERLIARDDFIQCLKAPGIEVEVAACPGKRLPARFADIDLVSGNGTQVYGASFKIDTPAGYNFFQGMSATMYMAMPVPEGVQPLEVPSDSLCRTKDGNPFVWIVETDAKGVGRAVRRDVRILWRNFDCVAVSGGIRDGDRVVVLGCGYLREGLAVVPVKEAL